MCTSAQASTVKTKSPFVEIKHEGGLTVRDKTNGVAQVRFAKEKLKPGGRAPYIVSIQDRKLTYPTISNPANPFESCDLVFHGSKIMTFKLKKEGTILKITEEDEKSKTKLYVNIKDQVKGIAHDVYTYLPKEISFEEASKRITLLKSEFPNLDMIGGAYNRHGVIVYGYDKGYVLYWANPYQEKLKMMACSQADRLEKGFKFKSTSREVYFRYFDVEKCSYINEEKAQMIDFKKLLYIDAFSAHFPELKDQIIDAREEVIVTYKFGVFVFKDEASAEAAEKIIRPKLEALAGDYLAGTISVLSTMREHTLQISGKALEVLLSLEKNK